ncbi:hypothetical protein RhiirB3_453264 [Rhizophagus irregularis]|nr:hypothetical protein RhiirB3_453264 [Rhizophagus irregularis]
MPIRCIAHHINLLTNNICKLEFAQSILKKCMKLVHFFKASHRAGAELTDEIKENMVKGGKLRGYCQTRWMTACDCVSSVLRCEEALKNVANNNLNYLKQNIKEIITRRFFMDIEELQLILKPIKEAIKYLEMKNATLADCFLQLIKSSYSIKSLSETHTTFRQQCIKAFNKRWMQFNFRLYMLAYLLHPLYRGTYLIK